MKKLFSVGQVTKSCDISRTTILRLESRGLLAPAFIDEKTGYRYYDILNITKILHIKLLLSLDMSYDDISEYYDTGGISEKILKKLEDKMLIVKRAYDEMRLRMEGKPRINYEYITLPEYVCFQREYKGTTVDDKYNSMYNLFHEAVEKGYKPLATEPLIVIDKRKDYLEGECRNEAADYLCCIPLAPDSAPKEAVFYPSCRVFSCLFHGDYSQSPLERLSEFGKIIRRLGVKPAGYPRVLGIVAPYVGREIAPNNYISRYVVPVEEEDGQDLRDNRPDSGYSRPADINIGE